MAVIGYLLFWAVIVAICRFVNKLRGQPVVNPGWVALTIFVLVALFELGSVMFLASRGKVSEFEAGSLFGTAIGKSLLPIIFSVILGVRFRKTKGQAVSTSIVA